MPMIWQIMPQQGERCKGLCIEFYKPVITMISTSAHKRLSLCTSQHPDSPKVSQPFAVNGQRLQVVDKFTYLGSTLSRAVHIDDEDIAGITKASIAFGRLCGNMWDRNGIRLDTKLKVYKDVLLPTYCMRVGPGQCTNAMPKDLSFPFKARRQDKIPKTEVLKRAEMRSVHTLLKLAQLSWTGHVTRMTCSICNRQLRVNIGIISHQRAHQHT